MPANVKLARGGTRGVRKPRAARPAAGRRPAPLASPFLVAGVGASAGGLEAFSLVLRPLPADAPLALVLVQHLARDHQSLLPELLAAKTALQVSEARDGQPIQPGARHTSSVPTPT